MRLRTALLAALAVMIALATTPAIAGTQQVMDYDNSVIGLVTTQGGQTAATTSTTPALQNTNWTLILGPVPTLEEATATTLKKPVFIATAQNTTVITTLSREEPAFVHEVAMRTAKKPILTLLAITADVSTQSTERSWVG